MLAITRRGMCALASFALMLGLGGMASAQSGDDWNAVIAAAKKEGVLVAYGGAGGGAADDMLRAFEKAYGIRVEFVRNMSPAALRERARSEQASGHFLGDIVISGSTIRSMVPLGHVEKHKPLPNAAKIKAPAVDDGYFIDFAILPHGVLANTAMVSATDMPKRWEDFLDPKWKDRILAFEPRAPGPGLAVWGPLYDTYGRGYIEKLVAQRPVITSDGNLAARRVAQGEFPFYMGFVFISLYQVKGLPVMALPMSDGMPYAQLSIATLTKAPHPNAARLAMNFMLSEEMQRFQAEQGLWTATGVTAATVPDNTANVRDLTWLGTFGADRIDPLAKVMTEVLKTGQ